MPKETYIKFYTCISLTRMGPFFHTNFLTMSLQIYPGYFFLLSCFPYFCEFLFLVRFPCRAQICASIFIISIIFHYCVEPAGIPFAYRRKIENPERYQCFIYQISFQQETGFQFGI